MGGGLIQRQILKAWAKQETTTIFHNTVVSLQSDLQFIAFGKGLVCQGHEDYGCRMMIILSSPQLSPVIKDHNIMLNHMKYPFESYGSYTINQ